MTSNPQDDTLAQAMDWLLRLNAAPQDQALQAQHAAWLTQDAAHQRAWARAQQGWAVIGLGEAATAEAWPEHKTATVHRLPKRNLRPAWCLAAAAAVLLLVSPVLMQRYGADYAAFTGEIRQVSLQDGSAIQLAPDSAINVSYSGRQRSIELLRGKAFFDVAKETERAFVVTAGDARVTVLGTAFDVQMDAKGVLSVNVARGAVAVQARADAVPEQLIGGDGLAINTATGEARRQQVAVGDIAAWREGRLFVVDASIAEVVTELRHYSRGWIVLADSDLGAVRVNGLYDLRNPEASLRALMVSGKGQVQQVGPFLTILRKP